MRERSFRVRYMRHIVPTAALVLTGAALAAFYMKQAKESRGTSQKAPDAVLLLGCRVRGEKAEPTLMMRIEEAAEYLCENKDTEVIVCGGIVHKDQYKSEAAVMYDELIKRGVEKERIILEDESRTTVENFLNAKKILNERYGEKEITVAILSSEFHLMRARVIAERCGLKADTIPAPSPKNERVKNYVRELFAFPLAYKDTKGVR